MDNLQQDSSFIGEYIILGNIIAGDGNLAEYIWVDNGIIKNIGNGIPFDAPNNIPMTLIPPDWYIIPGLYDAHVHLKQTAIRTLITDLNDVKSIKNLIEIMDSSPLIGDVKIGMGFDETKFLSRDIPTKSDLDKISDTPVMIIRVDSHSCVVNNAFYKLAEKIGHDLLMNNDGILKGEQYSHAYNIAMSGIDSSFIREAIVNTCKKVIEKGMIAIHAMEGGSDNPIENARFVRNVLEKTQLKGKVYPQTFDIEMVLEDGFDVIGGCILVDGSIGSRTAAVFSHYKDSPGESGCLYLDRYKLTPFVKKAGKAGLQVALHTIGDRAIEEALSAYKSVGENAGRKRFRLEHFVMATDEQIECAKNLDICVCMQPTFDRYWGQSGGMYEERLDKVKMNRIKSVLRSGIHLSGGSDSDITPMDSILGISSAMSHNIPEERLTFDEALSIFTYGGAYMSFDEKERGLLKKNYYADFIILDCDPRLKIVASPDDIKVLATFIDGNPVYISDEFYSCGL